MPVGSNISRTKLPNSFADAGVLDTETDPGILSEAFSALLLYVLNPTSGHAQLAWELFPFPLPAATRRTLYYVFMNMLFGLPRDLESEFFLARCTVRRVLWDFLRINVKRDYQLAEVTSSYILRLNPNEIQRFSWDRAKAFRDLYSE